MLGFVELCERIDELWRTRRDDLVEQADQLTEGLGRSARLAPADGVAGPAERSKAVGRSLLGRPRRRGVGSAAPKFPQTDGPGVAAPHAAAPAATAASRPSPHARRHGGRRHLRPPRRRLRPLLRRRRWLVPHFEKMLYDNALLDPALPARLAGHRATRFRQVVDETIGYVLRDLRHPGAASPRPRTPTARASRGKFYVWTDDEVRAVLGDDAGAQPPAVVVRRHRRAATSRAPRSSNRMHAAASSAAHPRSRRRAAPCSPPARTRVRPGLDDKVLTEWNGLMLAALAEAAAAAGEPPGCDAEPWRPSSCRLPPRRDGRWLRSWQADAGARHLAYAADHAALRRCVHPAGRGHRPRPAGSTRPGRRPTPSSTCSGTTSGAACSRPDTTPRRSSCRPRT